MNHWPPNLKHVLILGLGASGRAAAKLALAHQLDAEVLDTAENDSLRQTAAELAAHGAVVRFGRQGREPVNRNPDLIIISPGIAAESELGQLATGLKRPVIGEFEFGALHCKAPIVAVTGSNGKTTTVEITAHCLKHAGVNARPGGNIGTAISEIALYNPQPQLIIAEISSFQLERINSLQTLGAAFLNLSSDHLDRHYNFNAYARTKAKILQTVTRADQLVLREDLIRQPFVAEKLQSLPGKPIVFAGANKRNPESDFFISSQGELCRRYESGEITVFAKAEDLPVKGLHNLENAMAAAALCELAGVSTVQTGKALRTCRTSDHRLKTVLNYNGIQVIDDSKSTNPDALCRALQSLLDENQKQIILIAGGLDKKMDFSKVKPWLRKAVKKVLCIGSCRHHLANLWQDATSCEPCDNFQQAVQKAVASAQSGDTVLLSPACSSHDMFTDYAERGRIFIELISKEIRK